MAIMCVSASIGIGVHSHCAVEGCWVEPREKREKKKIDRHFVLGGPTFT